MDILAISRNQEFNRLAETAVRTFCKEVHEITYIEHGADNLIVLANRAFVFRFPRNEDAAKRLYFETALLQKIAGKVTGIPIPEIVHVSHQPLFVVAKYIEGVYLTAQQIRALSEPEQMAVGEAVALFVAQLNQAVSGLEIRRLRTEAGVDSLQESWEPYFTRLFASGPLPNDKLRPVVEQFYPLWQDYIRHEDRTLAIHDDLHPANLLFVGPKLSGILDFGDANTGGMEEELRWLYLLGDGVLRPAIAKYQALTGQAIVYDHIRVWAIMHELSSFTSGLAKEQTESFPFIRAQANLRSWLPDFPL